MSRYREALGSEAIAIHDKQKEFSDELWSRFVAAVRERVPDRGDIVDAGVGSGVVAARLCAAGFCVSGFDFNESMVQALRRRTANAVRVALADVTALPVRSAAADGVVITNVLHLVRHWRSAIAEAARVLKPGGVLLVGLGNTSRSAVAGEIASHFRNVVGAVGASPELGVQSPEEFDEALTASGFTIEEPLVLGERVTRTVRDAIERLQHNVFTWSPDVPQQTLDAAAVTTSQWAEGRYGSLSAEYEVDAEVALYVARKC